jgi:ferredoxin-NADP reductase
MVVLRCTQKLLRRLHEKPAEFAPSSSTLLGDWYAKILWMHRRPLVLAVSARTLLPVLLPARDPASLGPGFAAALGGVLAALGVPADQVAREQSQMAEVAFASTMSRQILGTMNDFDRMLDVAPGQSLIEAALDSRRRRAGRSGWKAPIASQ